MGNGVCGHNSPDLLASAVEGVLDAVRGNEPATTDQKKARQTKLKQYAAAQMACAKQHWFCNMS